MPKCELCGWYFKVITASHLKYQHSTTVYDYMKKFPNASIQDPLTEEQSNRKRKSLSDSWWSKSEEERWKVRETLSEAHKGQVMSEEAKRKIGEASRERQSTEKYKEEQSERMSKIMEEVWTRPEYRALKSEQQSKTSTRLWNTPEYREKTIKAQHTRPSLDERLITNLLEDNFPGLWEYVGDRQLWGPSKKSPDWLFRGNPYINKAIEYDSYYWHNILVSDPPEEKLEYYWNQGYKLLIILDSDLWSKGTNNLIQKVEEFIEW